MAVSVGILAVGTVVGTGTTKSGRFSNSDRQIKPYIGSGRYFCNGRLWAPQISAETGRSRWQLDRQIKMAVSVGILAVGTVVGTGTTKSGRFSNSDRQIKPAPHLTPFKM